jgi:transcriptional regulator with XRE-family HTH domain
VAREGDEVAALRRDLGRRLAERRKAAGYVQREFGALVGYSRTAVANAETGHARIGRQLWERADRVLGTGELFACGFERIRARASAAALAARTTASASDMWPVGAAAEPGGLASSAPAEARLACRERGWPAEEDPDGRLWLVTGIVIDALEVPRAAGVVAVAWWLYTRGVPDEMPALPDPATALAAIAAGERCYFLARSGASPWTRQDAAEAGVTGGAAVRWHAGGSRVLAPPSPVPGGDRAAWAHAPSAGGPLASPMALLHLLAQAVTATRDICGLVLPGGVRAVPATGDSSSEQSHG